MKARALLVLLALTGVAIAQPGGSGSGAPVGSGSGSGSGKGPKIIQLPTDSQAPSVSASAAPTEVRLGGKFTVFVTATFGEGVEVNLREPLELGSAFEVTRKLSEDKPAGDGRTTREWQVEVIAWELGDLVMPPIAVTYTAFGKADQVETNRVNVRVIGVLGDVVDDPKAMRGNADPKELWSRDWFWLWVSGGGLVVVIALVLLVRYVRKRRRRTAFVGGWVSSSPKKFDTPSSRALDKLQAIGASGILDRDEDRKQGYADMVEVIREYLGSRYHVATYDLTSHELIVKLVTVASTDECRMVEHWLDQCDIVKYGGFKATAADAHHTLDDGRNLVVTTTQKDQPKAPSIVEEPKSEPAPEEAA